MIDLNKMAGPTASDEQIAAATLHACMLREWAEDPCWLVKLLLRLKDSSGVAGIGVVQNIDLLIQRLNNKVNVLDEIWYTHWVQDGLPFVDRAPLRDTLRDLARVNGRSILRIEGDSCSGKTYSSQLLEHVSLTSGLPFRVINIKIEKGSEIGMDALLLSRMIVGEMGFPSTVANSGLTDPTVHEIPVLQTWILGSVSNSKARWWLFLDGFRFLPESNSARNLIQGLAEKIATGSFRQWLRLILVDYDKPLARVEDERIVFDTPDRQLPSQLAEANIRDCLNHLYLDLGRVPQPGELETKAQALLTNIPPTEPWIVTVNKRLRAAARGIRNGL
jgi:hypothetical protein